MAQRDEPAGPPAAGMLRRLAGGFAFSSTPMLLVNAHGRVEDVNAALSELTDTDLAGVVGAGLDVVAERLRPRAVGPPLPPELLGQAPPAEGLWRPSYDQVRITESPFVYDSQRYGRTQIETVCVPSIDAATGTYLGSVVNFVIRAIAVPEDFAAALRERWSREILWTIYAVSYDRILPEMPFYREVVDRHLEAIRAAKAMRVLDLGAGTGNVAVPLLDDGREVVAVDASRAMITRLKSKVSSASEGRLTVIVDTAEHLPQFPDHGFDGVSALLSFFDMDEPRLALAEAVRLLRPGGTLVITDPKACFDVRPLMEFAERHLREGGRFEELRDDWSRVASVAPTLESRIRARSPEVQASAAGDSWNAEWIFRSLRESGFTGLTFRDSHLGNCATIAGCKPAGPNLDQGLKGGGV
jgi:ubiquinone/menaquinone biosynthesis C-methylase UbiE